MLANNVELLNTEFNKYSVVASRSYGQFFLNDSLSDFTLIDGDTGKRHRVHRIVMASASGFINKFLNV